MPVCARFGAVRCSAAALSAVLASLTAPRSRSPVWLLWRCAFPGGGAWGYDGWFRSKQRRRVRHSAIVPAKVSPTSPAPASASATDARSRSTGAAIDHAVEMAFRAEVGTPFPDPLPAVVADRIATVTDAVMAALPADRPGGAIATVEEIQDEVERAADGGRSLRRRPPLHPLPRGPRPPPRRACPPRRRCRWTGPPLDRALLRSWIAEACRDRTTGRSPPRRSKTTCWLTVHPGMTLVDLERSIVLAARARIEIDPAYSFVAARALLRGLYA